MLECPFHGQNVVWEGRDNDLALDHITFACSNNQILVLHDVIRSLGDIYDYITIGDVFYLGEIPVFIACE